MGLNGATRGAIAGAALAVGVITGGVWTSDQAQPATTVASCQPVFAGRAGTLPCQQAHPTPAWMKRLVGTTLTGCGIGLASGGPAGAGYGCLGGLLSNIPWA